MQKPRSCQHCKKTIPVDTGFYFDEKLNLICGNCHKIAFLVETDPQEFTANVNPEKDSE